MENSIEEDMKILKEIIKGDEDCINAIYSQMKVKNDNDEDIQYFKKEIQSIENIVNNYLKEKARADKLEKEYSIMLSQLDERKINYKRTLKENEELNKYTIHLTDEQYKTVIDLAQNDINQQWIQKVKDKIKKEIKYHEKNILDIENITMLKGKTAKEEAEIEFNKYAIVVLKKMLQELLEWRK